MKRETKDKVYEIVKKTLANHECDGCLKCQKEMVHLPETWLAIFNEHLPGRLKVINTRSMARIMIRLRCDGFKVSKKRVIVGRNIKNSYVTVVRP